MARSSKKRFRWQHSEGPLHGQPDELIGFEQSLLKIEDRNRLASTGLDRLDSDFTVGASSRWLSSITSSVRQF
jgi:hypothetical protein